MDRVYIYKKDKLGRIGFFKVDNLATILLMDDNGHMERREFEIPICKNKL
jgi:hypothetical protein